MLYRKAVAAISVGGGILQIPRCVVPQWVSVQFELPKETLSLKKNKIQIKPQGCKSTGIV